jgi:hypothetical protein
MTYKYDVASMDEAMHWLCTALVLYATCASAYTGRLKYFSPDYKLALVNLHERSDPSVEVVSWEGRVFIIRNLLNDTEADHLIELGRPSLARSSVVDSITGGSKIDPIRNSRGMFLERLQDETVTALEQRISKVVLLPVSFQEDPQVGYPHF